MCRAALQLLALPAPRTSRPAAACELRPAALPNIHHPALQPAPSCPAARASRCPAARASRCPALRPARRPALQLASRTALPCSPARRALLQPARRALLRRASRPAAAHASRSAALHVCALLHRASRPAAARASCSAAPRVAPCCPAQRPSRPAQTALPSPSRTALPRSPAPPSRPADTTGAAAARATAAAGGGAAGSAGSATGAGGTRPTTDRHCLSLPLSRQLQRLGEDSSSHCLSWTTPPLSSFTSGFFSKPVQVVEALTFCAAAIGASESAAALGASESATALGASDCAAALGARASPATGPSSAEALHTFTLDPGMSRCFFRDCTTLTPLAALAPVSLADPTGGPVVARASTVLPCAAVPSSSLSGLHLPPFLTNLTLLWHHRLGHPSLPHLRSMHSRLLVSSLPRSLPSLPHSPAPPCLPCVKGWQRAAPHSSEFPPTTAPVQTLHMDVWGPAPVGGTDHECYFLLVIDDYTRYTTVFPLWHKVDISNVFIPWIRATRRQLRERFSRDFPVPRLHCDRGSEFSSDLLRRIGLIMEVARTSMIHAAAPHFLWSFAVR
ncbi:unnamed protein product [Closterium sp. NIES-53]